jgi:hypothetical protein
VKRGVGLVATQARGTPLERRARLRLLIERVEDDALLGILDGELEKRRSPDVADGGRVVEIDRARVRGPRIQTLDAGLRHHQQLRFNREMKRVQYRPQVSGSLVELEAQRAVRDPRIQFGDRVVRRLRVVGDRRMPSAPVSGRSASGFAASYPIAAVPAIVPAATAMVAAAAANRSSGNSRTGRADPRRPAPYSDRKA